MSCSSSRLQILKSLFSILDLTDDVTKALMSSMVAVGDCWMYGALWRRCATEPSSTQVRKILTLHCPKVAKRVNIFSNSCQMLFSHSSIPSKTIHTPECNATLERKMSPKAFSSGDRVPLAKICRSCDPKCSGICCLRNSCFRRLPKIRSS